MGINIYDGTLQAYMLEQAILGSSPNGSKTYGAMAKLVNALVIMKACLTHRHTHKGNNEPKRSATRKIVQTNNPKDILFFSEFVLLLN